MKILICDKLDKNTIEELQKLGTCIDVSQDKDKNKAAYFKIPVSYEISGNYLGYLKFRRALAKSNKVINFDREEIKVIKGGGINSVGTLSIVGLPDEYK